MANEPIHYVHLVGIKTKEAMLIESFLNMASGDGYVFKVDNTNELSPKALVVDELFHSDSLSDEYPDAKIVVIGDDVGYEADDYLHRPLKWSTFEKRVIEHIKKNAEPFNQPISEEKDSLSPDLTVDDDAISTPPVIIPDDSTSKSRSASSVTQIAEADTDIGLTGISDLDISNDVNVSPDDQSVNNSLSESDYSASEFSISQIAIKDANEDAQSKEYSESVSHSYSEIGTVIEEDVELVEMEHSRVKAERTLFEGGGLVLGPNIVFWENFDCLMTVKSRPVLYILSSMGSVYSEYNYLDWGLLLKSKYARVYPLPNDWTAHEKITKYPLEWLVWFSSIARSKGYLLKSINKDDFFMLDVWPDFDQIYNDNNHLRLSSLLSTAPYSIQGLVSKTRLPTKTIVSYLNACKKQNLLLSFSTMEEALEKQKSVLPPIAS